MVAEGFDDLLIGELEQAGTAFDESNADTECGEHATVLHADDTAADDDHGLGQVDEIKHQIGVNNCCPVNRDLGRRGRFCSRGDQNVLGFVDRRTLGVGDLDVGGIFKTGDADEHFDVVAGKLGFGNVNFGLDDVLYAEGEIRHGDAFFYPVVHPVDGLVVIAGKVKNGLTHGL